MHTRVEIQDTIPQRVIINVKPAKIGLKAMLLLILIPCLLLPLIGTYVVLSNYGPHIGILIIYLLFWGPGLFIFRSLLWNSFGKEVLEIHSEELTYYADFKYFKDGKQQINLQNVNIKSPKTNHKTDMGRLIFKSGEKQIETVIEIPMEELKEVMDFIGNGQCHKQ